MHADEIREYCLARKDVEETFPFGQDTLVFKTRGKIFLLLSLDEIPLRFNVKCDPDEAVTLRDQYPDTILPGYHMNKKHWNTVVVNGSLKNDLIKTMIDNSYRLVGSR
ncbi:MAG: MmcQ/YjbR family DNA-binding protein [Chitinophagaceae bacterium]|nr:MAG: MmcQ/YjbR family DNA-binding protein [Chitinophagaceae bacterium]